MQLNSRKTETTNPRESARRPMLLSDARRRGSTLMIVMVLMGMLSLLGVIFYLFTAQERSNSNYYAEAAKVQTASSLTADMLFDWALEQIIVGTDQRLKNSMLWGSRHSMLSNLLGFGFHRPGDSHPFNGEGVNVIFSSTGNLSLDQNRDGLPDSNLASLGNFVDSPAAQNLVERNLAYNEDLNNNWVLDAGEDANNNGVLDRYPQSDVGYTYPDINNVFLAYVGKVRDSNGLIHRVVKPSYMVPGILRTPGTTAPLSFEDANYNGQLDAGEDLNGNGILDDWCVNPNTKGMVMRGHPYHLYVPPNTSTSSPSNRYLTDAEATVLIGPSARGFPFHPMDPTYNTTGGGVGAVFNLGRMGTYSNVDAGGNAANEPIEFDYDNDGDGFREAILMDLDFPVQQDGSGKYFVPMFLVTIHDLDSLINMNAHGNISKILYGPNDNSMASTSVSSSAGAPFGTDTSIGGFDFISKSNLGLGPAEVNPVWALNARPPVTALSYTGDGTGAGFTNQIKIFGGDPRANSPTPQWGETGNMELLMTKIGAPVYGSGGTITDLTPGVYGEEGYTYNALTGGTFAAAGGQNLPRPGISKTDDNNDVNEGQLGPTNFANYTVTSWDFQHPLDWTGQGTFLATGKTILWNTSNLPNRWIRYNKYANSSSTTTNSYVRWGQNSGYMSNSLTQALGDDPYEVAFYPVSTTNFDNLFDSSENIFLQLNNSENSRLSISARLKNLAPFNFSTSSTENIRGESIRRKFTTDSNDRKNYGLPFSTRAMGAAGTGQEYNTDTAAYNPTAQGQYVVNPAYNSYRFPPEFRNTAGGTSIRRYKILQSGEAPPIEDPFRPFTRALLESDNNYNIQSLSGIQQRLSVNKLLTIDPTTGKYIFRELTRHPDDPGTAVIDSVSGVTAYPPTTAAGQEYWARRDRQQLCRDIYVLLYLLGHGDDTVATAMTSNASPPLVANGTAVYSEPQLREMAQFAVNLVDAMDRDSVMTRFEYDKDLSDGWNLDDDSYGTIETGATPYATGSTNYNSNYPNDSAVRGEVFGVESLDLTLNEGLVINTIALTTSNSSNQNPSCTPYDDSTARNFAYVEIFNPTPRTITFDSTQSWQIVLKQDASGSVTGFERRLTLGSGAGSITSGGIFTVGSADFSQTGSSGRSTFKVDPTGMSSPINIAPTATIASPQGLDLVDEANNGTIVQGGKISIQDQTGTDISSTMGAWANGFGSSPPTSPTMRVVLRRRAHPTRSSVSLANVNDNPWVDVDCMSINVGTFSLADTGTPGSGTSATNVQNQLKNVNSKERPQPLYRANEQMYAVSSGSNIYNSLLVTNNNPTNMPPSPFNVWQPHFDREFASIGELMLVPLYAPYQLTMCAYAAQNETPEHQIANVTAGTSDWSTSVTGTANSISAKVAAAKFMVPEDSTNFGSSSPTRYLDNRWHRLLEFIEVPTRTNYNLGIGIETSIPRVPGKMNLNAMRYPECYAALLDDSTTAMLNLSPSTAVVDSSNDPLATMDDQQGESGFPSRDWWQQFLLSRDGVDPYWQNSSSLGIPLPGIPSWPSANIQGARPFRSMADVSYNALVTGGSSTKHASIEDTLLRSLPVDRGTYPDPIASNGNATRRRLLEVGTSSDHITGTTVDPMVRHRLLSKVWGNTTTRSNCYAVFISVKYFQAVAQGGAIRVGGPYNGKPDPEHRGFFVVDRTKIEQGRTSNSMGYDFRAFVNYRKTLATQ